MSQLKAVLDQLLASGGGPATPTLPDDVLEDQRGSVGAPTLPRGVRNNNPGNIRRSAVQWRGEVPGGDPEFEVFDTPESGLRALETNLQTYQNKHGLNTVAGIIDRWAPPEENNTSAYVAAVAESLGVAPDDPIDVNDPAQRQALRDAIVQHENGQNPYAKRPTAVPTDPEQYAANMEQEVRTSMKGGGEQFDSNALINAAADMLRSHRGAGTVSAADFGRAALGSLGSLGVMAAGAGEYLAGKAAGDGSTAGQMFWQELSEDFAALRKPAAEYAESQFAKMSPEAQDRAARKIASLDPNNTIWQGGAGEFFSSVGLKTAQSLAPTLVPLLGYGMLARTAIGGVASTLYGLAEGTLSMGSIAAQAQQDVMEAPIEELMQSDKFKQRLQESGGNEVVARHAFVKDVQGATPIIAGAAVGLIAKGTGTVLDDLFNVGKGAGVFTRFGTGAVSESTQEAGQSAAEQIAQNVAKRVYNSDTGIWDGVLEQALQGAVVGGPMGGTVSAVFGRRKAISEAGPVPDDVALAAAPSTPTKPTVPDTSAPLAGGIGAEPNRPWQRKYRAYYREPPPSAGLLGHEERPPLALPAPPAPSAPMESNLLGHEPRSASGEGFSMGPTTPPTGPAGPGAEMRPGGRPAPDAYGEGFSMRHGVPSGEPAGAQYEMRPLEREFETSDRSYLYPESEPREKTWGRELTGGWRVRRFDKQGNLLASNLYETRAVANAVARRTYAAINRDKRDEVVEVTPARRTFHQDRIPDAEPVADVMAQFDDMRLSDDRLAVYLSKRNVDNLRDAGELDRITRSMGVPIKNFDGSGGFLIAKNDEAAQELLDMRDNGVAPLDEIIGYAIGAGYTKPAGDAVVLQKFDRDNNVIRETTTARDRASKIVADWGGDEVVRQTTPEKAAERRRRLIKGEKARRAQEPPQDTVESERKVSELYVGPAGMGAVKAKDAIKPGLTETETGEELIMRAAENRQSALAERKVDADIPAPKEVIFRGKEWLENERKLNDAVRRYEEAVKYAEHISQLPAPTKEKEKAEWDDKVRIAKLMPKALQGLQQQLKGKLTARPEIAKKLSEQYASIYDRLVASMLVLEELRGSGSKRELLDAETERDRLLKSAKLFLQTEGGYTEAEALVESASRFSPKARKAVWARTNAAESTAEEADEEIEALRKERKQIAPTDQFTPEDLEATTVEGDEVETAEDDVTRRAKEAGVTPVTSMVSIANVEARESVSPKTVAAARRLVVAGKAGKDFAARVGKLRPMMASADVRVGVTRWLSELIKKYQEVSASTKRSTREEAYVALLTEAIRELGSGSYTSKTLNIATQRLAERVVALASLPPLEAWKQDANVVLTAIDNGNKKELLELFEKLYSFGKTGVDDEIFSNVTRETLDGMPADELNLLYVEAVTRLDHERVRNSSRTFMVDAVKRWGPKFSDTKILVDHDTNKFMSARQAYSELFSGGEGMAGTSGDRRMPLEQLRYLYAEAVKKSWDAWGRDEIKFKDLLPFAPEHEAVNKLANSLAPSKKKEIILRVVNKLSHDTGRVSGKSAGTKLTRTVKDSMSADKYSKAESRYNPGVLLKNVPPRELSKAEKPVYEEKVKRVAEELAPVIAKFDAFLTSLSTGEYQRRLEKFTDNNLMTPAAREALTAKVYARWLRDYAASFAELKGGPVSEAAVSEALMLIGDLNTLMDLKPAEFIKWMSAVFNTEMQAQRGRAQKASNAITLMDKRDPEGLYTWKENALRETIRVARSLARIGEIAKLKDEHPTFVETLLPITDKIRTALAKDGWYSYEPSKAELHAVRYLFAQYSHDPEWLEYLTPKQAEAVKSAPLDEKAKRLLYRPAKLALEAAGFFDRDVALEKRYTKRFGKESEATHVDRIQRTVLSEEGRHVREWVDIGESPSRREGETAEQFSERLMQPRRDAVQTERQKARIAQVDISDEDVEKLISYGSSETSAERIRLTQLLDTDVDNDLAVYTAKLLGTVDSIAKFRKVLNDPKSTIARIEVAEALMLETLQRLGALETLSKTDDTYTIGLKSRQRILDELAEKTAELGKLEERWANKRSTTDAKGRITPLHKKYVSAREILATDINTLAGLARRIPLSAPSMESVTYRAVGKRLREGRISKKTARETTVLERIQIKLKAVVAEGLTAAESAAKKGTATPAVAAQTPKATRPAHAVEREAHTAAVDYLENAEAGRLGPLLALLQDKLGEHAYRPLIRRLLSYETHRGTPVRLAELPENISGSLILEGETPVILINKRLMAAGDTPAQVRTLLHTILHEAVHAATTATMAKNPELLKHLDFLRSVAAKQLKDTHKGATSNVFEFVTESYTSPEFQNALREVKIGQTTVWKRFIAWVRKVLGTQQDYDNVLEYVVALHEHIFGPAPYDAPAGSVVARIQKEQGKENPTSLDISHGDTAAYQTLNKFTDALKERGAARKLILDKAVKIGREVGAGGGPWVVKSLTMRQLVSWYSHAIPSLKKYGDAFFARNHDASEALESADRYSRDWTRLEESKPEAATAVSKLMLESTLYGIHPDAGFPSAEALAAREDAEALKGAARKEALKAYRETYGKHPNSHLTARHKARWEALSSQWNALPQEAKEIYTKVRNYYRTTAETESKLLVLNAIRASGLWEGDFTLTEKDINFPPDESVSDWLKRTLKLDFAADKAHIDALISELEAVEDTLDKSELKSRRAEIRELDRQRRDEMAQLRTIVKMATVPLQQRGPYFPIRRFGDYIVRAHKLVETKTFATVAEKNAWIADTEAEDPTLQIKQVKGDELKVEVFEEEVRRAETYSQAEEDKAELIEKYGADNVSEVDRVSNDLTGSAAIPSNTALQTLLNKLDGNPGAQAAIRQFYLKSLSDHSFRKGELHRKKIRGFEIAQQHRTFAHYAKSAAYYTAQLRHGHEMASAKQEMNRYINQHRGGERVSTLRMRQVYEEIALRDQLAADIDDLPEFVRKSAEFGQLMLLASPSYWMVNASQPWMVTLPWMVGYTSPIHAAKVLGDAQRLVIHPLLREAVKSKAGLKALLDKTAAEDAFSVLEQVKKHIENNAGAEAPALINMLDVLRRDSIIDLSFVAELRQIAAGASGKVESGWNTVMDASRIMAHLTEVNNRIMTAVAAYRLAKELGPKLTDSDHIAFARKALAETQFDYSASNKPRLFAANDAAWKPLVFQFMQYTQHMYVLMIQNVRNVLSGSPIQRKIAARTLSGLLGTHLIAGGLVGATLQPIKWAFGLLAMAFGDDDEDNDFRNVLSGETYDRAVARGLEAIGGTNKLTESLRAGAPRLVGSDWSARTALGQLYMADLNPKNAETLAGSFVMSFLGPLPSLLGNLLDGTKSLAEGDLDKAADKFAPKGVRDILRTFRYADEGITDNNGKIIMRPSQLGPVDLFWQSLGFAPAKISEMYDRNAAVRDRKQFANDSRAEVLRAFRMARVTGEHRGAEAARREYNLQFPHNPISYSDILKGLKERNEDEQTARVFGTVLGDKERQFAKAGSAYNVR